MSSRVRVIDIGKAEDRFALPKASIIFSTDGKRLLGVQDRPACRVLRYAADAAHAAANVTAEERDAARVAGRRQHAAARDGARSAGGEREWELSPLRGGSSAPGLYKARLAGSEGVAACLIWHPDLEGLRAASVDGEGGYWRGDGEEDEQQGQEEGEGRRSGTPPRSARRCLMAGPAGRTLARPSTAPPAASTTTVSLDLWRSVPCGAASPRFKSRSAFEQRRAATPDTDAIKRRGYLVQHKARRAAQEQREAKEAELLRAWPHGLPHSKLRLAGALGLRLPGLGATIVNTPWRKFAPTLCCG